MHDWLGYRLLNFSSSFMKAILHTSSVPLRRFSYCTLLQCHFAGSLRALFDHGRHVQFRHDLDFGQRYANYNVGG